MTVTEQEPLTSSELDALDAWWRAANYLSAGQIYLLGNPLLTEPLRPEHVKPRLLGHWGTTPGLNIIYAHLNRVIRAGDLSAIYIAGPGHGGPGMAASTYLEGTCTELYPRITQDSAGLARLFRQFSFPGGIPSHAAPETPGSIHEGGELGYSLSHAYGAAFDNPDLIVACVIGDGEAETGPLATSWHSNKFLDPATDGAVRENTRVLGGWLRDVIKANPSSFRLFGPDETSSNRLDAVFDVTHRVFDGTIIDGDNHLAPQGQVMEVLSEHQCEGWLEGYLLTGRHGLFNCYEAFIHIVDSMFNQHAKWLKVSRGIGWRRPVASLNYLLSSLVWRQDHNGFSHQDPGFIDHVVNKKAEVIRVYLPPDANTLLSTADHCLRSRNYVNVIVAGKQPQWQWLTMDEAVIHCTRGAGIWEWASNDAPGEPDVVMACCGDTPTLETLAAVSLLREHLPSLKVRVVNVVDLMRLEPETEHPHGMSDAEYDALFTTSRPVVFAYHGYPSLIHRLTYKRSGHQNLHVRGYQEEGTTTTPFDMVMMNDLDRFHLVMDVIDRVPGLAFSAGHVRQLMMDKRISARAYTRAHGEDAPEITDWKWSS